MNLSDREREATERKLFLVSPPPSLSFSLQRWHHHRPAPHTDGGKERAVLHWREECGIFCRRMTLNSSPVMTEMLFLRVFCGWELHSSQDWSVTGQRQHSSRGGGVNVLLAACWVLYIQKLHAPIARQQAVHTSPENCLVLQSKSSIPSGAGAKKHLQFGKVDPSVLSKSIREQDGNRNIGDFVKTHNLLR